MPPGHQEKWTTWLSLKHQSTQVENPNVTSKSGRFQLSPSSATVEDFMPWNTCQAAGFIPRPAQRKIYSIMECMSQRKRSLMYIKSSLASLNPYDLHKKLINEYLLSRKGSTSLLKRNRSGDKCDSDVIRENHRFLWDDDDIPDSWEAQLAKKYYDKLFKEYCICDLSRYKENKVAMRWRTEQEVVVGKGQFSCGDKHCSSSEDLRTWEVNFGYIENGEKKNALVKARLCAVCSDKLNYKHRRREITRKKKRRQKGLPEIEPTKKLRKDDETDADLSQELGQELNPEMRQEDESALWREAHQGTEEKTRDQEFEEYLEDLFM